MFTIYAAILPNLTLVHLYMFVTCSISDWPINSVNGYYTGITCLGSLRLIIIIHPRCLKSSSIWLCFNQLCHSDVKQSSFESLPHYRRSPLRCFLGRQHAWPKPPSSKVLLTDHSTLWHSSYSPPAEAGTMELISVWYLIEEAMERNQRNTSPASLEATFVINRCMDHGYTYREQCKLHSLFPLRSLYKLLYQVSVP